MVTAVTQTYVAIVVIIGRRGRCRELKLDSPLGQVNQQAEARSSFAQLAEHVLLVLLSNFQISLFHLFESRARNARTSVSDS